MLRVMRLAEEEVPQPKLTCFHLQLLDHRNHGLPSLYRIFRNLRMREFHGWKNFILRSNVNIYDAQKCAHPT